ncbi:hypothetical protein WN093_13490 [Gammaproteobacteria bacterium AS21]
MVSHREGFQKSNDLAESGLPKHINTNMVSAEEFAGHMLDQPWSCQGLVLLKAISYLVLLHLLALSNLSMITAVYFYRMIGC